ncbi:hypothetical protein CEXT_55591 [Caerostris extrusa]|uniref:Uncharacterized protein n=1 Tax=Caerostris extrusa TaxID=172846 RepID=A0AAV4NCM7_CAEEX|nr:hypothetical protein CEXT_55591 [Caerostris extrusa]
MSGTIKIFLEELKERLRTSDLNQRESLTNKPRAEEALEIAGTFSCIFLPHSFVFSTLYGKVRKRRTRSPRERLNPDLGRPE